MELIIFIAVVVVAALLWNGYVNAKKTKSDDAIDRWIPGGPGKNPEQHPLARFNNAEVSGSEYRVESTAPDPKCGCGRSPTGSCVGLHKLTAEEWAVSDKNPNRVEAVAAVTAANKVKAAAQVKKEPAKKPAVKKSSAKKKSV